MAVYDKELIINGEAVRSPEQQVFKNMKDIQALKEKIKNVYSTSVTTLTSSSVSIATANVDGLGTATEGWLLDPNGLLFKITANDGTTTTLQYYSDLKGPQGEDGAAVNIDDSITSLTKVWSSMKTNNEITGLIDDTAPNASKVWSSSKVSSLLSDGIYWTASEPTLVGSEYQISGDIYCGEDIINPSGTPGLTDNVLKEGDMIAYVDNDGKIASIWYYISGSSPKVVAKVGDIGGGKQLYQHIIYFDKTDEKNCYGFYITTDSATKMTWREIANWLKLNNYQLLQNDSTISKGYPNVLGRYTIGSTQYTMLLVAVNYEDTAIVPHANSLNSWSVQVQKTIDSNIPTYYEVIPL